MQVKLFLRNINQDHIGGKTLSDGGWSGNVWSVECCVIAPVGLQGTGEEIIYPPFYQALLGLWLKLYNGIQKVLNPKAEPLVSKNKSSAYNPTIRRSIYPTRKGLVLRKETEGGIFWDPNSNAVYSVDEEAYHAILELDRGFSDREVARRIGADLESVRELVHTMKRIRAGGQLS